MGEIWKITVWGVRGSIPRPSPVCTEYGGNTVCTSLEYGDRLLILDAGTGLLSLGQELASRKNGKRLDILLSHFHIDHVLGLYAFPPFFNPHAEIRLYGGAGLQQYLETLVSPPFWPLGIQDSPAKVEFYEIRPGDSLLLDGLTVSTMAGNHPGGSLLYRLDGQGKSLTYALDCETDESTFSSLAGFARKSDLLIWDASFTASDLRPGWGHSTWEQGLELGCAAQAGQVLMTHYSWDYSDKFIHSQEIQAQQKGICRFAKEGETIIL